MTRDSLPVVESPAFTSAALVRAVEVVSAAYEEAMRRHGLLAGTVRVIQAQAWQCLARALVHDATADEEQTL